MSTGPPYEAGKPSGGEHSEGDESGNVPHPSEAAAAFTLAIAPIYLQGGHGA